MILDESQEALILYKIRSRISDITAAIEYGNNYLKWRYIQCLHDILGVLMFLEILTVDECNFLTDGSREKYRKQ